MITIENIVSSVTMMGIAFAGAVATKIRKMDTRSHSLELQIKDKPNTIEIKELISDKLEPLHVLLREIKEDIQELKQK